MKKDVFPTRSEKIQRREFLRRSVSATVAAAFSPAPFVLTTHATPNTPIRVGVIGCGGRGTGAVLNALGAATKVIYPQTGYHTENVAEGAAVKNKDIQIVALADLFPDRLMNCRKQLAKLGIHIPDDHCFTGWDAYKKLLAIDEINYVIQATPPHFRPDHVLAAVQAGKNVFMEKPAAVDPVGVRKILQAGKIAADKGLSIVAGTQRRHHPGYQELMAQIHNGALGKLMYGHCYWNGGTIWTIAPRPEWSEMEWQIRNWNYFTWLSGDHIVEQHVHNLDIMNWAFRSHPIRAWAVGGRLCREYPIHGNIYDHFAVSFEYPDGVMVFSQCRQMQGAEGKVEEHVVGTKGVAYSSSHIQWIRFENGNRWRARHRVNPYEQEHQDLIRAIRTGQPINEAQQIAESTLTGILGRECAYSGQTITWDQILHSDLQLGPKEYRFGSMPIPPVRKPCTYSFK